MPSLKEKYKRALAEATTPRDYLPNKNALLTAIQDYRLISNFFHGVFTFSKEMKPTTEVMRELFEDWLGQKSSLKGAPPFPYDFSYGMDGSRFRFAVKGVDYLDPGETYYEIEIACDASCPTDDELSNDGRPDWCIALFQCNHAMVSSNGWDYDHLIVSDRLELNK